MTIKGSSDVFDPYGRPDFHYETREAKMRREGRKNKQKDGHLRSMWKCAVQRRAIREQRCVQDEIGRRGDTKNTRRTIEHAKQRESDRVKATKREERAASKTASLEDRGP